MSQEHKTLQIFFARNHHEKSLANEMVLKHHSYVASIKTVGRVMKYLIKFDDRLVGTFWLGSGFKPTPKAILNYFNMKQAEFDKIFNEVADNKRFAMVESIPNLGSQVLRKVRERAASDWLEQYGDNLRAIVTTIGADKSGAVYLADNWKLIGETSGLPTNRKAVSMKWNDADEIAQRYVKPSGENKKLILVTERLTSKAKDSQLLF